MSDDKVWLNSRVVRACRRLSRSASLPPFKSGKDIPRIRRSKKTAPARGQAGAVLLGGCAEGARHSPKAGGASRRAPLNSSLERPVLAPHTEHPGMNPQPIEV